MERVPEQTINRLPIYLRCLIQAQALNMPVINSLGLAQMAGTNAAQVRKDLSHLGELGTRGIGYDVESLIAHISRVLGLAESRRVAIVGFGRLGGALLGFHGFAERGFDIVAVFDNDPAKVGTEVAGLVVRSLEDLESGLRSEGVEIVLLTTPPESAQEVASRVVQAGIRAILNFAPMTLDVPDGVKVRPVDLSVELQVLSFHLARMA
ncbi:MAG: redox-sensing transcriptional repressor Rex [Coriobacteriia bacterium]|nr:redox-sensing transcriptional repressor Rex [Coriobacteriia bacterium]